MGGSEEFWEVGGVFGSSDEFLGDRRSFGRVSEEISGGGSEELGGGSKEFWEGEGVLGGSEEFRGACRRSFRGGHRNGHRN